jgi:hypothetical protein
LDRCESARPVSATSNEEPKKAVSSCPKSTPLTIYPQPAL